MMGAFQGSSSERVHLFRGTSVCLRYCCAHFERKHSPEQSWQGEGEIHRASFSVVLNK